MYIDIYMYVYIYIRICSSIYTYLSIYLSIYQKKSFSFEGRRSQHCWRGAVRNTASERKWHIQDNQGTILALVSRSKSRHNLKFLPLHSDAYPLPNRELLLEEPHATGRCEAQTRVSSVGCGCGQNLASAQKSLVSHSG